MREYQGLIITASSVLISVPLLALSFLANSSTIPRIQLGGIASLEVASAISFAISLILMIRAHGDLVRIWVLPTIASAFSNMTKEDIAMAEKAAGKPFFSDLMLEFSEKLQKMREEKDRDYLGWSVNLFLLGIGLLICSLGGLALTFLT
jgi:hypothetical protein